MSTEIDKDIQDLINGDRELKLVGDELGSDSKYVYSFECPPLDVPYGGGIRSGRIYEVHGAESHGKTTLVLNITIAFCKFWREIMKTNKYAVLWVESENTLDRGRAMFMGCMLEKFIFYETDIFEDGRDKIGSLLERSIIKDFHLLCVWDTVASTSTKNEKIVNRANIKKLEDADQNIKKGGSKRIIQGPDNEQFVPYKKIKNPAGLNEMEKPKLLKKMLRDITYPLGKTDSTMIFVNQVLLKMNQFGNTLDSGGGQGLRHHASARTKVTKIFEEPITLPDGRQKIRAIHVDVTHVKNKIITPKLPCTIVMDVEKGLDVLATNVLYMKRSKILPQAVGGWTMIEIPNGYYNENIKFELFSVKFQTIKQLENLLNEKYPWGCDWINYTIYKNWSEYSSLIKANCVKKMWEYEEKFFGKRLTSLTDAELSAAKLMYRDIEALNAEYNDLQIESSSNDTTDVKNKKKKLKKEAENKNESET